MVAAAKLGARVGFIGTAGTDTATEIKLRTMVESGIDLSRLVRRPGPESQIIVVCVHAETGERLFSGLQSLRLRPLRVEELDREYITGAEYLHLEGFHIESALQAAKWMKEAGKTVVFDANEGAFSGEAAEQRRKLVEYVDVFIGSQGVARVLTGIEDIWDAGMNILEMGPRIYVETAGKEGSYTITAGQRFHTPAFQVKEVDTTGAGDVFHGAYIVGLLHGWELPQISRFASAVSAIKCTQLGGRSGIPDFELVRKFLLTKGIQID
jgi:sulfofructose kinase